MNFSKAAFVLLALATPIVVSMAAEDVAGLVAFAREHQGSVAIVIVPRFVYTLMKGDPGAAFSEAWREASVALPPSAPDHMVNVFTGERWDIASTAGRSLLCRDLFRHFPVVLLTTM